MSSFGLAHEELSRTLSSARHGTAAEAQQHSSSPWTDGQMLPPLRLLSTLDTPGQYIYMRASNLHISCVSVEKQHAGLLAGPIPNNYDQKWPANVMFNYENLT